MTGITSRIIKIVQVLLIGLVLISITGSLSGITGYDKSENEENSLLGNYLAGRFAKAQRDTNAAANYYREALKKDPGNSAILEQAFLLEVTAGHWEQTAKIAADLIEKEPDHQIAQLYLGVMAVKQKRYQHAKVHFAAINKGPIAELTALLAQAWVAYSNNDIDTALKLLDGNSRAEWAKFYQHFHKTLITDLAGRKAVSRSEYARLYKKERRALRITLAYAQHLANAGKVKLAQKILKGHIKETGGHPEAVSLLNTVSRGEVPKLLVDSPEAGLAEVFYGIGDALAGEGGYDMGTIYLQLALLLKPDFVLAHVSLARVYERTQKYENAITAYGKIPESSPLWLRVQIRKASNLNSLDRIDEAKTLLAALADKNPTEIRTFDTLANILRFRKRYAEAVEYYNRVIELIKKPEKKHWIHFYSRGVCYERLNKWDKAEADLKKALELDPDQALVLNYLGYSWVDQNRHLDRALRLIRKAIKLKPGDGYLVDSLGWAYYRLGNYKGAVAELEKAVELKPEDPVINDHLGDAYWRVKRFLEARYQWKQALSLKPEQKVAETIRMKIKEGLPDSKKRQVGAAQAKKDKLNKTEK